MQFHKKLLLGAVMSAAATLAYADDQVTIIHIGDIHGHLAPRPDLRSNSDGHMVGGLARMATEIKQIQKNNGGAGNTLVINTGDTIQGSGEALYTRGQALVDVIDMFGVDAYTPGNWDFVYGPDRFKELFVNKASPVSKERKEEKHKLQTSTNRWGAVAANLYATSTDPSAPRDVTLLGTAEDVNVSQAEYDAYADWYLANGQRILPPYSVKTVNGVKIGILGCTTSRGPQVVGRWVTNGLEFTDCSREAPKFAEELRTLHRVQLVVLISEIEIGRNIQLIQNKITKPEQHIDLILNSDMHEETLEPIEVTDGVGNKTWIIEEGQDGSMIGEVTFSVDDGQVMGRTFTPHRIDDRIKENKAVAKKVAKVSYPFTTAGFNASIKCDKNSPYWNSFTQATCLNGPLDAVVGSTNIALHRSNYSHEHMPAAIEGTSHDFIADAIRWWAKSDLATVRGFRYGTHVAPGPITRNDLFHFVPIGPRIGKASRVTANQLRNQIDNSSLAVFSNNPNLPVTPRINYNNAFGTDPLKATTSPGAGLPVKGLAGSPQGWGGGWLFAYSGEGFHFNFDPYYVQLNVTTPVTATSRSRSLMVKMLCKHLPPVEQATANQGSACDVNDGVTRYTSTLNNSTNGQWMPSWTTSYITPKNVYLLNPDGWQFLQGTANQPTTANAAVRPFQAPLFTVAGYWYGQSPDTINNCNNCYPTGTSNIVGDPEAAYLLPVNVGADGNAALDASGNPLYKRDGVGNIIIGSDNKPVVDGNPIDLTMVIEKYLASLGGEVSSVNLPTDRISLVNPLADSSNTLGFPVMQPLCGIIALSSVRATCP